jgi:NADH dehydrogenase
MILVTGGSGFVGCAIVKKLLEHGHRVRVVSRHAKRLKQLPEFYEVDCFEANVSEKDALLPAMAEVKAVIHLIGVIAPTQGNRFENAHVETTREVVKAMQASGVKRLLHMSALGTRPHAASLYHQTKWAGEEVVRASGLDWTIFRPSLIYGANSEFIKIFSDMMRFPQNVLQLGCVPCFGDGTNLFQPIAVEEVAHCFIRALTRESSIGKVFELCGLRRLAFKDLLRDIARAQGKKSTWVKAFPALYPILIPWKWVTCSKPLIVAVPFELAYVLAGFVEKILPKPPVSVDAVKMLEEDNVGQPEPAMKEFDFAPKDFWIGLQEVLNNE